MAEITDIPGAIGLPLHIGVITDDQAIGNIPNVVTCGYRAAGASVNIVNYSPFKHDIVFNPI
jgi:hypothetical protein